MPPDRARASETAAPVWTRAYAYLLLALFFTYLNMALLPVIPLYVESLGGSEAVSGIALAVFSIASFGLRPWVGRLVDVRGPAWVMTIGAVVLVLATAGLAIPVIATVVLASAVRGVGWAAVNTASYVLLSRLSPASRRAEASGYFSLFQGASAALAPIVALYWIAAHGTTTPVFLACAACTLVLLPLARPSSEGSRTPPGQLAAAAQTAAGRRLLVSRSAALPSVLVLLVMATQPAVLGFLPLYARSIGVSDTVVLQFFVVSGLASLVGRSLLGRISDLTGPGPIVVCGMGLIAVAVATLVVAAEPWLLIAVGACYSAGQGMALPALTALAIQRAEPGREGLAMATYSGAFQLGLGAGGLLCSALIPLLGYGALYGAVALVAVAGICVSLGRWSQMTRSGSCRPQQAGT